MKKYKLPDNAYVDDSFNPDYVENTTPADIGRGALNFGNSLLLGGPAKIKWVKKQLDKFKEKHPMGSLATGFAGDLAGGAGIGKFAIKKLGKVALAKGLLNSGRMHGAIARGAVMGAAPTAVSGVAYGQNPKDTLKETIAAGVQGGAIGAGAKAIGNVFKAVKSSRYQRKKAQLQRVAAQIHEKLGPNDISHIKNVIAAPKNKILDTNNLILNPTEKTKAIADAVNNTSPEARSIIERLRDKVGAAQQPYLESEIMKAGNLNARPNVADFTKDFSDRIDKVTNPLYERAYATENVAVDPKVQGDYFFKKAHKGAMSKTNALDRGRAGYRENDLRTLHKTQQGMDSEINALKARGESINDITESRNRLSDALKGHSKHFDKAQALQQSKFNVSKAAQEGGKFSSFNKHTLPQRMNALGYHEKKAFTEGALEKLLNEVETVGKNAELGVMGRKITTPVIKDYMDTIIGKTKSDALYGGVKKANKAVQTLNEIGRGSNTAKHESNRRLFIDLYGSLLAKPRALINMAARINKANVGLSAGREGKIKAKLLMNPKLLMKLQPKPSRQFYRGMEGLMAARLGEDE